MTEIVDRLRIAFEVAGEGAPTFAFVHGYACDRHDWPAQVTELSSQYRTIVMDLPGHGESETPAAVSVAMFADTVMQVCRRHHDGQVLLVGHSMGVRVVLEASRRHPDLVAGVVLVDGSRMADSDDPERAVAEGMKILSRVDVLQFSRMAFEGMFAGKESPLREAALARVDRLDPSFAEATMVAIWRWDAAELKPALSTIKVPILLLQSTHIDHNYEWDSAIADRPNPWIELVTENAPQTEVCIISGAGHFTHIDAPDRVNAKLAQFARKVAYQQIGSEA